MTCFYTHCSCSYFVNQTDHTYDKTTSIVFAKRVKMHRFLPSGRYIMTVVGKSGEHWVDVNMRFCSCRAFYFAMTGGKKSTCYHLTSAQIAYDIGAIDEIVFDDEEFDGFVHGLVLDV